MTATLGLVDVIGAAAAASTLVAFAQRSMFPMRVSAITANALFIVYGGIGAYYPVLVLHLILLPLNIRRLIECGRLNCSRTGSPPLIDEWRRHVCTTQVAELQQDGVSARQGGS